MKNIIITSGGTSEYIDKVRKITNSGSGKLGSLIANELTTRNDIDSIFYIHTPKAILPKIDKKIKLIEVVNTNDVKIIIENLLKEEDIFCVIHSMAISDYYVDYVSTANLMAKDLINSIDFEQTLKNSNYKLDNTSKISSNEDNLIVVLKQTPKIINLIKKISPNTKLIGFKLLENVTKEHLIEIAIKLKDKNNCDFVIANDLKDIKDENHKAYLLDVKNNVKEINGKINIAKEINKVV